MDTVREVGQAVSVALGLAGMLGYVVHFIWASFHTNEGTSQARSLFSSLTVFDRNAYTPRGQQLLRRMWLSLLVFVLSFVFFALATSVPEARHEGDSRRAPEETPLNDR